MSEPWTVAGKAMTTSYYANPKGLAIRSYIEGIEHEAAVLERERLRNAVGGLGGSVRHENCIEYADILAVFTDPDTP